jgi:hypothetical protein
VDECLNEVIGKQSVPRHRTVQQKTALIII